VEVGIEFHVILRHVSSRLPINDVYTNDGRGRKHAQYSETLLTVHYRAYQLIPGQLDVTCGKVIPDSHEPTADCLVLVYHCFASFKQSPLDFFKLVDSRLILMLLYESKPYNHGVHQSHLGWGHRSEKVNLRALGYVPYKTCQCAVLLKDKIIIRNVFGSY